MMLSRIAAFVALTVIFVPIVFSEPLHYKDCGGKVGKLLEVDVSPCSKQPCPLVKGQNYTINVTFTSDEATPSCKAKVYGLLVGVPVPFPLPEPDGCKSGLSCPLQAGQTYTYLTKLPIKSEYPDMKLTVRWELLDTDGNNLFCWDIPVMIVDN
ncbi:NPC intracellular cholesterol transporter 2 [Gastrophryne carolinensis]